MAIDRSAAARGALAGAGAAAVWWAQQPLDIKVFGVRYDDTELLGKAVNRGPAWRPLGLAMHLVNGALFGAAYAAVAPRIPVGARARGPLAGLTEHLATWPGTMLSDRLHPARNELPALWGSGAAFAQATWRHLLFGTVLGEVERRLNPPPPPPVPPAFEAVVATNGHGDVHAVAVPR